MCLQLISHSSNLEAQRFLLTMFFVNFDHYGVHLNYPIMLELKKYPCSIKHAIVTCLFDFQLKKHAKMVHYHYINRVFF